MLSIYATTEYLDWVTTAIGQEDRLHEWVQVRDALQERPTTSAFTFLVSKKGIQPALDWHNQLPPFLLPEYLELEAPTLLGLIYARLGNFTKAQEHLQNHPNLWRDLVHQHQLQQGHYIDPNELTVAYSDYENYRLLHNHAIVRHYGVAPLHQAEFQKMVYYYQEALAAAPHDEYRAFTAKHWALLLIDADDLPTAEQLLNDAIRFALSPDAQLELEHTLCQAWLKGLTVPYSSDRLNELKALLWSVLQRYEAQGRAIEAGLVWLDASQIANLTDSFAESLGYVNKALSIFEQEDQPELVANAQMRRATLLFTWAKKGNPQFFKAAAETFQEALKVFTREDAPAIFAEIQHHLGVIYSEIPAEIKKKSIWAAVSSSAFKAALEYYTPTEFPYEYALICTNYGNALTRYPAAIHSDNYEKALFYYQEALQIRSPDRYPFERALTLLNYLEASWYVNNATPAFHEDRYHDMLTKAEEVKKLVTDPEILAAAQDHLDKLAVLRQTDSIS